MKKIRFVDGTEFEIMSISDTATQLQIGIKDGDASELEEVFRDADNLAVIQYFVGTDLMKGYARYTILESYTKEMNVRQSVDYSKPDPDTESGFVEEYADIFTVTLKKAAKSNTAELTKLDERVTGVEADVQSINDVILGKEEN